MKHKVALALLLSSPILADSFCTSSLEGDCYPYAVNPPLTSPACCVFGAHADFLYWRAYVENNPFVDKNTATMNDETFGLRLSMRPKDYKYDWDGGFRIGVFAGLPCNEWQIALDWTHFLTDSRNRFKAPSFTDTDGLLTNHLVSLANLNFQSSIISAGSNVGASSASSLYHLQLNTLDLLLKREFYVGHTVTLQPYVGLKAISLRQRANGVSIVSLADINLQALQGPPTFTFSEELSSDFKGAGIAAGLAGNWEVLSGFGIYGDASASILYGRSRSRLDSVISRTEPTTANSLDWEYQTNALKATLDLAVGIEWRHFFCDQGNLLTLRAGWENHIFFHQNTFPTISSPQNADTTTAALAPPQFAFLPVDSQLLGNITLQGLVISVSFSY